MVGTQYVSCETRASFDGLKLSLDDGMFPAAICCSDAFSRVFFCAFLRRLRSLVLGLMSVKRSANSDLEAKKC